MKISIQNLTFFNTQVILRISISETNNASWLPIWHRSNPITENPENPPPSDQRSDGHDAPSYRLPPSSRHLFLTPQIGNLTPPSLTRSPPASPPHQDKAGNPAAAADSRRFWKLLGHPTHSRRRPARCRKRLHA